MHEDQSVHVSPSSGNVHNGSMGVGNHPKTIIVISDDEEEPIGNARCSHPPINDFDVNNSRVGADYHNNIVHVDNDGTSYTQRLLVLGW